MMKMMMTTMTITTMMTGVEIKKGMLECNIYHLGQGKHCSPIFVKIDFCEIRNYDSCILPVCFGRVLYNSVSKEIMG